MKAFLKFAVGFLTRVCPPKTTNPVRAMNISVNSLTSPIALEILRDQRVLKMRTMLILKLLTSACGVRTYSQQLLYRLPQQPLFVPKRKAWNRQFCRDIGPVLVSNQRMSRIKRRVLLTNSIAGTERQKNCLDCKHSGKKVLRPRVCLLQIDYFRA